MKQNKFYYSVWVGGVEVNDFPLTMGSAWRLAQEYIDDGYDDVEMEIAVNQQIRRVNRRKEYNL